jgi:hypothetical protein
MSIDEWPPEQRTRDQVDRLVVSVVDRRETTMTRYDGYREIKHTVPRLSQR